MDLKFRAWNYESMSMAVGRLVMLENSKWVDERGFDLMQWTGLTDVNGMDIYAGDILSLYFYEDFNNECVTVEAEGDHKPTVEVSWDKSGYWLFCEEDGTWYFPQSLDDCAEFKVIGNIHQNADAK